MRGGLILRQAGVVRAVHRREDRILAARGTPSLADRLHRHAHRVRRLVTGDARARVGTDWLEERMALGVDGTIGVQARPAGRARWRTPDRAAASRRSRLRPTRCAGARAARPAESSARRGMPPHRSPAGQASEREHACARHFSAVRRAAHVGVAHPTLREPTYSAAGSTLSPACGPCIFAGTGGSMPAASSRFRIIAFASALALRGTSRRAADRSGRHVVVHAGQPRRAAASRRPRSRGRRIRRHPVDGRCPAARRELDADDALAARVAGPSRTRSRIRCVRRARTSGWARLWIPRPSA